MKWRFKGFDGGSFEIKVTFLITATFIIMLILRLKLSIFERFWPPTFPRSGTLTLTLPQPTPFKIKVTF